MSAINDYRFTLEQHVRLKLTAENGHVIGRAEYTNKENQYLVRYCAADGRQVEAWFDEDALTEYAIAKAA